ncbi:peroxisomal acyl-CoA thioesterase [Scheffersomyces stipitis CBS 6054]|uniref:Peroxisomal acyl-CoA thioesterase n=1 Tax=Scheffersomyces stipitis (strain ATCC 58785 / CBS 6054 / NBRC 10063 / NRRL Y-11545) TaxID=322104 RepID=A3LT30_PICST|nr:peroxisomal acyl-CoA thioesterase [Scheffersomyces stipitis CBS 6054]ABN65994.2 peroxisomal acyl-CoA thioesterase [Scheffersomyces stipitis CBS 6054]
MDQLEEKYNRGFRHIEDFEEAFRVVRVEEDRYVGAHRLELPMIGARGVYGGHTAAQSLLVGIRCVRDDPSRADFLPESFHMYFIAAGDPRVPMSYEVAKLYDDENMSKRSIKVIQKGRVRSNVLVTMVKPGYKTQKAVDIAMPVPPLQLKYPDPNKLYQVHHTGYVRNAYSDEFVDYSLCPEEDALYPAERWITKIMRPHNQQSFKDPTNNYVALADLSDSALLTTMARVLHLPWNPTEDHPFEEIDHSKNAMSIMPITLNALHLFHYNAMSLDHHIYFHNDNIGEDIKSYDAVKDWLCLTYQMTRHRNSRTLVRGFMYNKKHQCVATIIQEGLTIMHDSVPEKVKL